MSFRVNRVCAHCGDAFTAKRSDVARGWANCCSRKCAAKHREHRHANHLPPLRRTSE